jgi:predicted amidohydrolase
MSTKPWTVAAIQTNCLFANFDANLARTCKQVNNAAVDLGARLVVLPECALTGYGFKNRADATRAADTVPGKATDQLGEVCASRDVFAIVGMIERDGDKLFNASVLVGPNGLIAKYRKVHLPCIGLDRFVDPGDLPLVVHDLGGLKVGLMICFDASFPEAARVLTLAGADLIALPTNWTAAAAKMAEMVCRVRALENHVYFVSVNRVGEEVGFCYIGRSSISDFNGDFVASAAHDQEDVITAVVDPEASRRKTVVVCSGEYEIDRVTWRRPEFYGRLTER